MIGPTRKSLMTAALGISASLIANAAIAGGNPQILCHNIGGPRDLGANCEATGLCEFILQNGSHVFFTGDQFLGIVVGATTPAALAAHIAHGDGYAIGPIYVPPLHLASLVGPHKESNVECFANRIVPQPTEPGN
jgi:hypothetical protein